MNIPYGPIEEVSVFLEDKIQFKVISGLLGGSFRWTNECGIRQRLG